MRLVHSSNASNFASFSKFPNKTRIPAKSAKPSAFGAEGSADLLNVQKPPSLEFGNQSKTNSESRKSTVFRIGTNKHTLCIKLCFHGLLLESHLFHCTNLLVLFVF